MKASTGKFILFFTAFQMLIGPFVGLVLHGGERGFFENWSKDQTFTRDYAVELEKDPDRDFVILNLTDIQLGDEALEEGGAMVKRNTDRIVEATKPDLITVSDFNAATNNRYAGDARIEPAIASASAAIRAYCGWHVAPVLDCSITLDGEAGDIWLPTNALASVTSAKVGGEDVIAIGTDFDGGDGKMEIRRPAQMDLLFDVLKKKGLTQRQLDKFASGNVLRVMEECL